MNQTPPWEPPLNSTEADHLVGTLDRLRWTFRWKADGLDADALAQRLHPSTLTLGGLLKHLACCESERFTADLDGSPRDAPFTDREHAHAWAFASAVDDSPAELYALYDSIVERSRARLTEALDEGGLAQSVALGDVVGTTVNLRRIVCDLIEEYGRHTGHADLLRESIDGRVGEDPPDEWRPTAGH